MPNIETTGRAPATGGDDPFSPGGNGARFTVGALPDEDRRSRAGGTLGYNPALDGIRGIAVLAVLFFHGGFSWARGGYLGVSTFFTLSGFLITSLLVRERLDTGRVRLGHFWARRVRRLLPASALTLVAISLSALVVDEAWERSLRGDVLAALAEVVNWRFMLDDRAYSELFASPSPVLHFWSLAIEEQFYWLFPLVAVGVLTAARGSLRPLGVTLAALLAASGLLTVALGTDRRTAIYYATPVRVGEIIVGALLAVLVARRALPHRGVPAQRALAAAGVAALVASVWAWSHVGQASVRLYEGGLLAYAVVSGVLVLSATVAGPVRSLVSFEPLRLLGVVSYGVYLFHWPIFLLVDADRTNRTGWPLFGIRVGLTLGAAAVSYVLIERPVRNGWRPRRRLPMPALACGTLVAVALVVVAVPIASRPPADPFQELVAGDPAPSQIPESAQLGIWVGDSTALMTSWGLSTWGGQNGELQLLKADDAVLGCGLARGGDHIRKGVVGSTSAECNDWAETLPRLVAARVERYGRIDFAVIQTGPWDVTDHRLPGDDTWRAPGDPVYDDHLRAELGALTDLLLDRGIRVVWLTAPHFEMGNGEDPRPAEPYPESDPARVDRLNEIIRGIVASRRNAAVVDLARYVDALPPEMDDRVRPDGVHFDIEQSALVAGDWLGPAVVDAVRGEPIPPIPAAPLAARATTAAGTGG